jgi:hypothetical protein
VNPWQRIVVIGAVAILAFDIVASFASRLTGFPYIYASVGSWLIYAGVGYFAAKVTGLVGRAALAAGMVGFVESTLGWGVSRVIGPVAPDPSPDLPLVVTLAVTSVLVVVIASAIGAVGGVVGKRQAGSESSAPDRVIRASNPKRVIRIELSEADNPEQIIPSG